LIEALAESKKVDPIGVKGDRFRIGFNVLAVDCYGVGARVGKSLRDGLPGGAVIQKCSLILIAHEDFTATGGNVGAIAFVQRH
jgi:hypothetical protein